MRAKYDSLTIWKADINTGIYIALNGVALLFTMYKYQAVFLGISPSNDGDSGSSSETYQPDNKFDYYHSYSRHI